MREDNDPTVRDVLLTLARRAGITIEAPTAAHLTPTLASVLAEWRTLTRAARAEVEPMSAGRWPEGRHEVE